MKRMILLAPLALGGCAQLAGFGITPQSAPFAVAVGAETRAGANCIRSGERGDTTRGQLSRFRIEQGRVLFRGTVEPTMSQNAIDALNDSRRLTDRVCPALPDNPAAVLAD